MTIFSEPEGYPYLERIIVGGYLDPGTGYVFSSFLPALIGLITGTVSLLLFRLRKLCFPYVRDHLRIVTVVGAAVFILLLLVGGMEYYRRMMGTSTAGEKRVIVIGLDGMEANILEEGWKDGIYPNLRTLKEHGVYTKLRTIEPPQSPIVWGSFGTGVKPGKHGLYDFISRNPDDLALDLAFSNPKGNPLRVPFFWERLLKQDIKSTILFLPDTFPAGNQQVHVLAGMGVPDILGTMGASTTITTAEASDSSSTRKGKRIVVADANTIPVDLPGPVYTRLNGRKTATLPITITRRSEDRSVTIHTPEKEIHLKEGEFSDWIGLTFRIDFLTSIHGTVKFYLRSFDADFTLYMTPINISPRSPVFAISSPKNYAAEVASRYGEFYTQGLPHDTWALEEGVFDDRAFLAQADDILEQRRQIILGELKRSESQVFIGYFGILDTIQHMYWRTRNQSDSMYGQTIRDYYSKIDSIIGEVIGELRQGDMLLVLSDHGFSEFTSEFNMNAWLKENGFLTLKEGVHKGGPYLDSVDWTKTQAYAVGYNSIYVNLSGREKAGIVAKSDLPALLERIRQLLLTYRNPIDSSRVMKHVYTRSELDVPESDTGAPDLFVGYYAGTRSSWDTVVGATPESPITPRQSKWSGDHLFDASEVPGVLFSTAKIDVDDPSILDIAPTVFRFFGVPIPSVFDGHPLVH